jgi:hypothetical protein
LAKWSMDLPSRLDPFRCELLCNLPFSYSFNVVVLERFFPTFEKNKGWADYSTHPCSSPFGEMV